MTDASFYPRDRGCRRRIAYGNDLTAAFLSSDPFPRLLLFTGSTLAEPAVELPVVPAVHVAVPVEVEVPQVAGVGGARPERGPEEVAVLSVHVTVAV